MKRWLPAVAVGCLLAVLAVVALQPGSEPTVAARADALAAELRCPDCQGLSVADSPTRAAQEIKRQVDQLIARGATDGEVRAHFVARYGEWILLAPRAPAYWLIPFVILLTATGALAISLARRPRVVTRPVPLGDEQRRTLHEEVEALDA